MSSKRLRAEKKTRAVLRGERAPFRYPQATVGDDASGIVVPTRPGWIYVRLHGDPDNVIEVFNPTTATASGMVVDLERVYLPGASYYRVRGVSGYIWYGDSFGNARFYQSGITGNIGAHAAQHQRRDLGTGGFDPLDVYTRMLVTLRGQAQSTSNLTVYVTAGYYYIHSFKYWAGGSTATLVIPTIGAPSRYDLVYLGNDDALHVAQGTPAAFGATPAFPSVPQGAIPICFVYLTAGMTGITEEAIVDARVVLTAATTASGTGDASADAPFVLTYPFSGLPSGVVLASGILMRGTLGERPTSAAQGAVYFVTGAGAQRTTRYRSGIWDEQSDNNILQTGVMRGVRHRLNFAGSGVNVSDDSTNQWLNVQIDGVAGAAGGDLSGTYPNPTVAKLQGRAVSSSAPSHGQALAWSTGVNQWIPSGISGGGALTGAKYVTTASDATLSDEIVIPGFAGNADIKNSGGAGASEEYDSTTDPLTWNTAPTASDAHTTIPSHYYLRNNDTTEKFGTVAWVPAGAFDARWQISVGTEVTTGFSAGGVVISDSGNTNRLLIEWGFDSTNKLPYVAAYTYASGAYTQRGILQTGMGTTGYLRISRDASNNVSFWWSNDGKLWKLIETVSFTLTVAKRGYRIHSGAATNYYLASDWMRANV